MMNIFNLKERMFAEKKRMFAEKVALLPGIKEGIYQLFEDISPWDIKIFGQKQDDYNMSDEDIYFLQYRAKFDLLIVKEGSIVLCIEFCFEDDVEEDRLFNEFFKGMSVLKLRKVNFSVEELEHILQYIEKKIKDISTTRYSLSTISVEFIERKIGFSGKDFQKILMQEHILKRCTDTISKKCYGYFPTEYGRECGFIKNYVIDSAGAVKYKVFGTKNTYQKLEEVFQWKKVSQKPMAKKISLNKRINNLKSGRPSDNAYLVSLVKRSANLPVEKFFNQQLDKLKELKNIIREYDNTLSYNSYKEVTTIIYRILINNMNDKRGIEMMMLLAEPYLCEYKRRNEEYEKS